ncbi:MAG: dihydropteroate synthase [Balneolaceae bacterium]
MNISSGSSSLTYRGRSLDMSSPHVMGILNATPDSFSDGGEFVTVQKAIDRIGTMLDEGAAIIDIGGESTRPGAEPVSSAEEMNRVIPIFEKAVSLFPEAIFSADTRKPEVAEQALKTGVHIINDVSGLQEPRLAELCSSYGAGYILMHTKGDPRTMQKNPVYEDVILEITDFFADRLQVLKKAGVLSVVIDPGIGFGKTLKHNLQIIAQLQNFTTFGYPVLMGASRKSMIGRLLESRPAGDRLAGTLAVHYHSLIKGAKILRVHDVKEAADSIRVFNALRSVEE